MRTGFLFAWTAMLVVVGLASAQAPGTSPAPAGQSSSGQGAAAASDAGKAATDGKTATTPPTVQGMWDDAGNGSGGRCALLCGKPWGDAGDGKACNGWLDNNRFWFEGEYLLWRVHDATPPQMVQLFANTGINPSTGLDSSNARSGIRLTGGVWFDEGHCLGLEASFLYLDQKRSFSSTGILDVFSAGTMGIPPRVLVNLPVDTGSDVDPGDLLTTTTSGNSYFRLWGVEANLRRTIWFIGGFSFDALVGFRNMQLDETVSVNGDFTFSEPNPDESSPGPEDGRTVHMSTVDLLQTHDQFYGGQVGASFCYHCYRITVDGTAKFAVGGTAQQISTGGQTFQSAGLIEPSVGAPL